MTHFTQIWPTRLTGDLEGSSYFTYWWLTRHVFHPAGKPEPTIKWFREGKELTDQADFEIAYRGGRVSMTIPEAFEEDQGQYTCSAENKGGLASSTAELIVRGNCRTNMGVGVGGLVENKRLNAMHTVRKDSN